MTRIDFYLLAETGRRSRDQAACEIVHKAYRNEHEIYVQVDDPGRAAEIDELLWTFRDISFVPHALLGDASMGEVPVVISDTCPSSEYDDVLVNLANEVPEAFAQFQRVVEIVDTDESARQLARARYGFYRDRGYQLHTHDLSR
jgi:DNA polymerase-3 subunit chi